MEVPPPVALPAHHKSPVKLPLSHDNLFSFIFSQLFVKGSSVMEATPASIRSHCLPAPVPPYKTVYADERGNTLSYGKLKQDALQVAATLRHGPLGLEPALLSTSHATVNRGAVVSPVVLVHLPNCLPFITIAFGVLASGLTLTAANPALTAAELAHILNLSKPAAIITTTAGLATIQAAAALRAPEAQAAVDYARSGNVFTVDLDVDAYGASAGSLNRPGEVQVDGWRVRDWQTLVAAKPVEFTPPKYEGTEAGLRTAVIFWSSGTSGKSKGVMMSHKALGSALIGCWHGSGLKPGQEVTVGLPPMYHIFGWAMILQPGPAFGNTSTLISKFDPQSYLRLVQATRATHLHIAPPVAVLLAKSPLVDGFDLSSVRACTSGGAPLGASVIKAVYERHKIPVWMGYGLSETAGTTGQLAEDWPTLESLLGSSGTAYPGMEMRIASVESGKTVGIDETGEILLWAEWLMTGYLNNEDATAEAFDPTTGEFKTGDVGKLDKDHNLWIVDRLKEIIKVKGFQVAPADLEDSLCASALVQDAGVSSVYHEEHATEYPKAWVVPADKSVLDGGEKAKRWAKEVAKHIEKKSISYKWIRGGFVIVPAIPKSPSGKILRRTLKDTPGHFVQVYEEKVHGKVKAKL